MREKPVHFEITDCAQGTTLACRCSQAVLGFRTFRFAAFYRAGS
jgi:hypothetical protein